MKKQNVILAAISAFILIASVALTYKWLSSETELTIYLRCEKNVSGNLSAVKILSNGESGKIEKFNLETACQTGKINFGEYKREEKIQFTLEGKNGEKTQVISEYGEDIQSDQTGFYAILKLTLTVPFIAKDKI